VGNDARSRNLLNHQLKELSPFVKHMVVGNAVP